MVQMSRVVVTLRQDEREALVHLAFSELRSPRDQLRHILRRELQQRGFLPVIDDRQDNAGTEEAENNE
jgi:hypothetical protein